MSLSRTRSQSLSPGFRLTASLATVLLASAVGLQSIAWDSVADSATRQSSIPPARLSEKVSLRIDRQEAALISLGGGRDVITSFAGETHLIEELESDSARPLSLASADFDEDGVPDLVSSYAGAGGAAVALYRGNRDSIYPNAPEARYRKATGAFTASPFLGPARVFGVNEPPDFIHAGDFDGDSHQDIVVCRRGGNSLLMLPGDGRGGFGEARVISLPGRVTAVSAGDINRRDGLTDLVVAIAGDEGAKALVFEGPNGALRSQPEEHLLPAEAYSMAIGQLDDEYPVDLVVASGRELVFFYGRDRKLSLDKREQAGVSRARTARRAFSPVITSVAIGNFEGDYHNDIAVLTGDQTIRVLRGASNNRWPVRSLTSKPAAGLAFTAASAKLIPARLSTGGFDDLIQVGSGGKRLQIVTSSRVAALEADNEPVAVLPMRLDVDALSDLVVMREGSAKPSVAMTAPSSEMRSLTLAPLVDTFSNTNPITVPAAFSPPAAASPYPSTITVSGLAGPVDKVRVRLTDINITAHIVDILLVGPSGQKVLLMSDAGGPSVMSSTNLVFDDDAGAFIPSLGVPSGTYRPTNNDTADTFPAPAPAGPYSETLSVFDGTDPNGVWSLYLVNDTPLSPGGNVNGGWSLIFGEDPPPTPLVVTNTNDSGPGSLRQALLDSNTNLGADIIHFSIGSGAQTITPLSSLPDIVDAVTIDATTQPGFAGSPLVELDMSSAGSSSVGLTVLAGNSTVRGLVINRFGACAIRIRNGTNNIIEGNFIGTDIVGASDLGNPLTDGIEVDTANNLIGGTAQPARNLISGVGRGIIFTTFNSDPATGNLIQGNFIGTNASGTAAIGNSHAGISTNSAPGSPGNFIGGATAGAGNLISGNGTGIDLSSSATTGTLVQGNLIGLNAAGSGAVANGTGVQVGLSAHDNTVGGTVASTRNTVSGNVFHGVVIRDTSSTGNLVQGNFIGTDVSGTASAGNGTAGVFLLFSAANNTIGGMADGAGNLISGNGFGSGAGIDVGEIDRPVTTSNDIQRNLIGTDVTGTTSLANNGDGIRVPANADGNRIENNTIAFNTAAGVCIPNVDVPNNTPGIRISIKDNSIYSNATLGIDLGLAGVTANDPQDLDIGANNLQNFPVLTSVTLSNGMLHIVGSLNSTPNTDFFVQFFSSSQCMGSNPGQDQQVLNFLPLLFHTDASGNAPIDVTLTVTPTGGWVNCLATDPSGNTSEFS
ncbi:MAG TPA: FG-GAP-like repeat-containing protein, partial [Blastocatellia bacterium]|nr:FG-GAP-like repeat-containing protein [Blastocatellia bacterium]